VKKILVSTALLIALIVGFGLGYVFEVIQAGKSIGVQMYGPFLQSCDTALAAYKTADPTVAIWVLHRHLAHLDKFEKDGFPTPQDLVPQRFCTHARLAKLYAAQGDSQQKTKEMELALATGFMNLKDKSIVYQALSVFDNHQVP
jgi:hypothetical protein